MEPPHDTVERDMIPGEMFDLLVENVYEHAIFTLDPEGVVTTWNAGAQRISGYASDEIIGRSISLFYTPDALARHRPQHDVMVARQEGRFEGEDWRLRKDGTAFWAKTVIAPLFDAENGVRGFATITHDLTARLQIEELQRNERQMKRQMNEFLAMLAHELRNPLSPIQSALDVVERKPDDSGASAWARAIIQRQTHQLVRLVDDLLDVSRITRGRIPLRCEPVDINVTIAEVVESMRTLIDARRHMVEVTLPDEAVFVSGDRTRVAQILFNLVGNAIKYTPDGGRIGIRASLENGAVTVAIRDNGIGMAQDLIPRVFDLFVQGERGLDRREGGVGVGLTIAKRLAELQGGSLTASSAGPGLGSRFTVALPLLPREQLPRSEAGSRPRRAAPSRQRVLIVDDNEDAAEALATLIGLLGHEATVLHDGRAALGMVAKHAFDVMLLDIGLPGMDGFEVARRLRDVPEMKDVRLVACTGYARDEDVRRIGEAGFEGHLVKPVSAAQIERLLEAR